MAKSSKSRTPKGGVAERHQTSNKRDRVANWREGLARIKEEGRLLWLLGQGLDVMLTAGENDSIAPGPDQVAAAVGEWARQAMVAQPALRLGLSAEALPKGQPGPGRTNADLERTGLTASDLMLDGKPLSAVSFPVLWMGSREWRQVGQTTIVVGVGGDGRRRVLSVRSGSVREQCVAAELLSDLAHRGLDIQSGLVVVTAGSRILDEALRQTLGPRALVSHCRRQLLDDVASHVLEPQRASISSQIVEAWTLTPADASEALSRIAKKLQRSAPGAAERLNRSIDASLVADRLGAVAPLQDRLVSLGTVNQAMAKAHAAGHHGGDLVSLLSGLTSWLVHSRRIMGWNQLGSLAQAIRTNHNQPPG